MSLEKLPPRNFMYYALNRAQGYVQMRHWMTPQQKADFLAVLRGEARVVYNDDKNCTCGIMPKLPT